MIGALRNFLDNFRGSGAAALTVPAMDGAFRPNTVLETAAVAAVAPDPDNIVAIGDVVYFSSGGDLLRLVGNRKTEVVQSTPELITALAGAPDGRLAVARHAKGVSFIGGDGNPARSIILESGRGDVTAMAFIGEDKLALTVGSEINPASAWREDLMQLRRAGSVWLADLSSGNSTKQFGGLGYPYGIVADDAGRLIVSEAWQTRLVRLDGGGEAETALENLPGYPCRLTRSAAGGYWLSLFAPRNQLVELVLRERAYRERMMREVEPEYWVSPSLSAHESPLSPMQEGGQKIGGAIKPWAPSLSHGLIARLDRAFQPDYSLHSRANGRRHGVTSAAECGKRLYATSRGAGLVIDISL